MVKGMTLERTIMAAWEDTITVSMTSTGKTEPFICLFDLERRSMGNASNWKTTVQIESTLMLHEFNERSPKSISANHISVCLGSCQSNGVAKDVKSTPSS
jgi:hypothetical protein